MIAVDTNVLVYADREELPHHARALDVLRTLAEGPEAWALPVVCLGEFVRVVSHPRLFDPPTPPDEASRSKTTTMPIHPSPWYSGAFSRPTEHHEHPRL